MRPISDPIGPSSTGQPALLRPGCPSGPTYPKPTVQAWWKLPTVPWLESPSAPTAPSPTVHNPVASKASRSLSRSASATRRRPGRLDAPAAADDERPLLRREMDARQASRDEAGSPVAGGGRKSAPRRGAPPGLPAGRTRRRPPAWPGDRTSSRERAFRRIVGPKRAGQPSVPRTATFGAKNTGFCPIAWTAALDYAVRSGH
jgi:hypothetical protein